MVLRWTEAYSTGVPKLDDQHKVLFRATNDFRVAFEAGEMEEKYAATLTFLTHYIKGHFAMEEHCMEEYRCPVAQKNKKAHESLTEALGGFVLRFEENGYSASEAQALLLALEGWLDSHIMRVDVQLRDCLSTTR